MRRTAMLALLLAAPAVAEPVGDAADAVLRAHRAGNAEGIRELASRASPDPWSVAHELCARQEPDAAAAFAAVAPGKDCERLPAYVRSQRGGCRGSVATVLEVARAEKEPAGSLRALDAISTVEADVISVEVLWGRGLALRALRRYDESAESFNRVADAAEALGWWRLTSDALNECGRSAWMALLPDRALAAARRLCEVQEARGDRAGMARALINTGMLYGARWEHGKAIECQTRALEILEGLGDREAVTTAHINLGASYFRRGEFAEALNHYEHAASLLDETGSNENRAIVFNNIALVYAEMGDGRKAREWYGRSLAVAESAGDALGAARALENLGQLSLREGDPEGARRSLERALEINERERNKHGLGVTLMALGQIYAAEHEDERALSAYQRAMKIAEASGDRGSLVRTLGLVGQMHLARGEAEKALAAYEQARPLAEGEPYLEALIDWSVANGNLRLGRYQDALACARRAAANVPFFLRGLSEQEGVGARDEWSKLFEVGALAARGADDVGEFFTFLELGRAQALLEALGAKEELADAAVPPELRRNEAAARLRYEGAVRRLKGARTRDERKQARAEVDETRKALLDAIARIQREASATAQLLFPDSATLEETQAALGPDEVLVTYALFDIYDREALALVVTASRADILAIGTSRRVEELCAELEQGPKPEALAALHEALVEPLKLPAGAKRVLVSPHGPLAYVPFAALLDGREVVYIPSATTYLVAGRSNAPEGRGVLAVGDPDYAHAPPLRAGTKLVRLPGTRVEAEAVGDQLLLGEKATEEGLRAALAARPRWRALHLACHGLIDAAQPLFSGLALAASGKDDGVLTVLEAYGLDVRADLVVLSACETARGAVYRSEGVVGFARAFMFAGARQVLVSLWKVDDDATRELMRKFYELWKPGKVSAAAALRAAQDHVRSREEWRDPRYWAAWQLWD